jgi:hypothetical protein
VLCILATLASATGRDWLGLTGCDSAIPMHDNVVRENGIFEPFLYKKRTFCQDRLGTNIGKTQFFSQVMRVKRLLDARGSMSCTEIEAAIGRMTRSELW